MGAVCSSAAHPMSPALQHIHEPASKPLDAPIAKPLNESPPQPNTSAPEPTDNITNPADSTSPVDGLLDHSSNTLQTAPKEERHRGSLSQQDYTERESEDDIERIQGTHVEDIGHNTSPLAEDARRNQNLPIRDVGDSGNHPFGDIVRSLDLGPDQANSDDVTTSMAEKKKGHFTGVAPQALADALSRIPRMGRSRLRSTPGRIESIQSWREKRQELKRGWKDIKSSKRRLRRQASQQVDEESLASLDLSMKDNMPSVSTIEGANEAAMRLRSLVLRLEKETVTPKDMKENLEYAVAVLDAVRRDESRFNNEEDELSEVATDEVPEQVRNWLTSTFSRQSTKTRLGDEKPRFRSIVQALRTGLFIDRMFRRTSASMVTSFPPRVAALFKTVDDWSFDIFTLNREAEGHALKCIVHEILNRYDLLAKFKIPFSVLSNFLDAMEVGYSKHSNPYHNLLHAADVTQTVHHMLARMGLVHWITDLEILACVLAAVMHDFEHTGTTNNFHINTGSDMAYLYNDRAVLENHHVSSTFRLMREDDKNILANVSNDEFKELRNLIIEMVLATDMSFHFQQIKHMKGQIGSTESIEKMKALSMVLHCADISHAAKEWSIHSKWTQLLMREFFRQGDRERDLGLNISPLCDRNTTLIAESQIGFIDFIVEPSLQVCGDMIDQILEDELNSTSSTPDESIVSGKRNSIPLTRPSSAPRSSSVPAPTNHESSESRPPSSPGRLSIGRSNTLPSKCSRCWSDNLALNKTKWKAIAATEERGTSVFEHIAEEPSDFYETDEEHLSVSRKASIEKGNNSTENESQSVTTNGDMNSSPKPTQNAVKTTGSLDKITEETNNKATESKRTDKAK